MQVALIGFGNWGQKVFNTLREFPDVNITHIVTSNPDVTAIAPDVISLDSYSRLLHNEDLDAVFIVTKTPTHCHIAKQFAKENINVFVEKPASLFLNEIITLNDIIKHYPITFYVDHIYLYNDSWNLIKTFYKENESEILDNEIYFGSPDLNRTHSHWDWGVHPLSLYLDLLGKPKSIRVDNFNRLVCDKYHNDTVWLSLSNDKDIHTNITYGILQKSQRVFSLETEDKVIEYNNNKISHYENNELINTEEFESKSLYNSIKYFINNIKKEKYNKVSLNREIEIIKILSEIDKQIGIKN